jgi:hypothetical protein
MSSADWAVLDDGLATVEKGVTNGLGVPEGGGSQIYAFNSLNATVTGAAGLYCVISNFSPMESGGRISACIRRLASGQNTGFSPFIFLSASGNSVNDNAYLLGLEDYDPYRIVLRKATIISGIPQATDDNYLLRSSEQYQMSSALWHQLRLNAIEQPSGAVTLQVEQNILSVSRPCDNPTWESITGMAPFVDDAVGINTGSVPLIGGYAGFATAFQESIATRAGFDHIQIMRQAS